MTGLPLNIEGPVVYSLKDTFDKCKIAPPKALAEIEEAAKNIKACDPGLSPWVSRGLKSAAPYTFRVFLHNLGGEYISTASPVSAVRQGNTRCGSTVSSSKTTALRAE